MAQSRLFVGTVGPPAALVLAVPPGVTGADMTLVTSAAIGVRKPNGALATWSAVISDGTNFPGYPAPTTALLYLVHVYAVGDLDQSGVYAAWPTNLQPSVLFGPADEAPFQVSPR